MTGKKGIATMNEELTEQERLERHRIVDNFIAMMRLEKLEVTDLEVADLEAYTRGELSLEEVRDRTLARGESEAEKVLTEGREAARKLLQQSAITQERIVREAQQEAERIRAELGGPAERLSALLSSANDSPEAIRSLILHGTPEQTQLAAKYIAASPGGYEALDGSVRQILLGMGETELRETWVNRIRPMLTNGKMLPPERLQKLEADVESLLRAYQRGPALTRVQKYVIAALVTACVIFFVPRSFPWG
jgi:vacuolar-type H+-ATPase subunit H